MQLRKTLLVGLVASVLLAGCYSEQDTVTVSPLPKVENQFNPRVVWDKSVGNGIGQYYSRLSPVWQGSAVYVADRKGVVKALDIDSGKELWATDLSEKTGFLSSNLSALLSGGLTVSGDRLYIGTEKAKVIALDTKNGKVEWESTVAGEALSRPVVEDGFVLVHTGNGMLQALKETDGSVVWAVNMDTPPLSVRGESAPAVAYGAAIVGGDNGRISAVLLSQGQLIWQQRISQVTGSTEIDRLNDVDMTPVISGNIVYAIAYNGNLVALDMRSGQIIWKRDLGSVNDMVVTDDKIFIVDQDDRILSLRKSDGVTLWAQSELLHRHLTAPEMYNGYLVVGDSEGYLHWLNMSDGTFAAQHKVDGSGLLSRPVVAGDKLMVQAKDGTVYLYTR
ncbi:outer membrane protein assembly factor BamB [Xenorhabdus nematophila]|uniref:Outer membrane protein assembly factor BamB n=1 Tax=Xenorhabdus nematophila (strain ATCC 19061 / DSM 3370 / CCUG 14189 / LMG 1036 / NCIMB 9965 / AN6) TaxID=406817 RepID=D3VLP6_XENNA|nr:outer membrane protein assembly factor BamB [Xenorhabdus nematophila]CEE90479.1 putative serine/threonine protein kinase with quinoprotein alcohol dehydrogenase domain [Xenorhabdus nematophila str. Anatoliense]CEF32856.1 putative serine/threonine protein kinase with quinoprotein alcohol dehydrogenase domain [Xenorhabdus nematophila str. Websteri]AYA39480.1 outer membrane protein assembly factor BamB [Xenorhabdus nematophila]KHD28462.1 membrane biogenesis protein [Xenorhabdus nematophila]MBA